MNDVNGTDEETCCRGRRGDAPLPTIRECARRQGYRFVDTFNQDDNQLYTQHIPNASAWDFLKHNTTSTPT